MLRRRSEDVSSHSGVKHTEDHDLLRHRDMAIDEADNEHLIRRSGSRYNNYEAGGSSLGALFRIDCFRLGSRRLLQIVAASIVFLFLALTLKGSKPDHILPHRWRPHDKSPFSGAFARFPRTSDLSPRQQRITIVGAWNGDFFPGYLRHFFYSIQRNADVVDLLMINRRQTADARCMDFDKLGIDISWGGNIKVVCMDNVEWKKRHVDVMCGREYGWDCNTTEYEAVTKEYATRDDEKSVTWKPLRGYAVRDLFLHPENPFWSWIDHDLILGDFRRFPFNILSQLSFVTGSHVAAEHLFMAGQMTTLNFDDPALGGAWKNFKQLRTPAHFTEYIDGKMWEATEESYWSYGYFRDEKDLPGKNLSWGVYPDIHGDDYYTGQYSLENSTQIYVISGRDVLLVPTKWTREAIEDVILRERQTSADDLGNIGWTTGEDGSEYILEDPSLSGEQARNLALNNPLLSQDMRYGTAEMVPLKHGCRDTVNLGYGGYRQCVPLDENSKSLAPLYRPSLIRFPEFPSMHALRRMEHDDRPRSYERKLIRHLHAVKHREWFVFPDFDITDEHVMRHNLDVVEVWKMGASRNETLYYRDRLATKSVG